MKKRKRRVWFFVIAVPLVAVGVFLFFGSRENRDYVRAAKLLPEAKQRAREVFGPLTWEEFREEKGIVHRDDSDEWERIRYSIPRGFGKFRILDPPEPERFGEVFQEHRSWLLGLGDETETLVAHQPLIVYLEMIASHVRELVNALATGIVGAADVGDIDAVRQMTLTAWDILEKLKEETDTLRSGTIISGITTISESLLTAVARNSDDDRLIAIARELIGRAPTPPDAHTVLAGDARYNYGIFKVIQSEGLESLNRSLNGFRDVAESFSTTTATPTTSSFWDDVREYVSGLFNYNANTRHTGKHAFDALEARLWEVEVNEVAISDEIQREPSSSRERSKAFEDEIAAKTDLSYEFAQFVVSPNRRVSMRNELQKDLALLALEIMADHPSIASLPDTLPAGRLFHDPYGDGPVLYKKTATGFIVYSRDEDGTDGRFPNTDIYWSLRQNVNITRSRPYTDFGIIVNYEIPPDPESP